MPKNVVVIGGGTGTSVVLSALKAHDYNLAAIVSMADNGGSTGRLRDEFGFQPVGDLRQSLAALAREDSQDWIRKLLLYRFPQGRGLRGHNLGNLILTALQDLVKSTPKALEILESIFQLEGKVYPSTAQTVDLVVEYVDGTIVVGEDNLNPGKAGGKRIKKVKLSPSCRAYSKTLVAIKKADAIIISPGDLYASIIPNFLVQGMKQALKASRAQIIYILNLMTRYTQTNGFKASDHLAEIIKYAGVTPSIVIINKQNNIPDDVLKIYQKEKEFPVLNDLDPDQYQIIESDFISVVGHQGESDALHRSLIRHDEKILANCLVKIIK